MGRNPNDLPATERCSRGYGREILLSEVNPIGIHSQRKIQAVIHNEACATLSTEDCDLACLRQQRA
jgi:hypothetical protein